MNKLDYFARIAGDNLFKEWLRLEKDKAVKMLAAGEGPGLHRAQGRFLLLEELFDCIEKAKELR